MGRVMTIAGVITHNIFAQRVLTVMERNAIGFPIKRQFYFWGAQGPDFFYYYRPEKGGAHDELMNKIGLAFHRNHICDTMMLMSEFAKEYTTYSNSAMSYIAGFLTHYALDSASHPFVNSAVRRFREQNDFSGGDDILQTRIMTMLDSLIYSREIKGKKSQPKIGQLLPDVKNIELFASKLYSKLIYEMFSLGNMDSKIKKAFNDMYKFTKKARDPLGIKLPLIYAYESAIRKEHKCSSRMMPRKVAADFDYANKWNSEWSNLYDRESHVRVESFFDIFGDTVADAYEYIAGFMNFHERGSDLHQYMRCLSMDKGIYSTEIVTNEWLVK